MTCDKCKKLLAPADFEPGTPVACLECLEEASEMGYAAGEEDGYERGLREREEREEREELED